MGRAASQATAAADARTIVLRPANPSDATRPAATSSPMPRPRRRPTSLMRHCRRPARGETMRRGSEGLEDMPRARAQRAARALPPRRGPRSGAGSARGRRAREETTRSASRRRAASGSPVLPCRTRRRKPRPPDLASQAQHVQHRRVVAIDAGRQHGPFPGCGGQLEAVQRRDDGSQPVDSDKRLDGSTCCHAKRNRMKSAGLTGSISARRRVNV